MAQEFLNQLLRIENTVQKDEYEARDCMVCLERYGALNSSTGGVELPVRLPCNHLVGTICIATWLRKNNSCPACRATFFPAQPRPYLEYGIMDDHDEYMDGLQFTNTRGSEYRTSAQQLQSYFEHQDMTELRSTSNGRMGGWDDTDPFDICEWLCGELDLEVQVTVIARFITIPLAERLEGEAHSPECNATISVYVAWHLSNQGNNVSNFLTNLSRISDGTHYTRDPAQPARRHIQGVLAFLPTPILEGGSVNSEDNDRDGQVGDQRDHHMMTSAETFDQETDNFAEINWRLCEVLRDEDLFEAIKHLSKLITADMLYQADEDGWSAVLDDYSDHVCQAMCVFMACHFMGVAISYRDAARVHNTSERSLRQLYAYVFPRCSEFIDPDVTEVMGTRDLERVLGVLPALNWPSP